MSALTPKKMKEIDDQIRELKEKRTPKISLTIFCDVKNREEESKIAQKIMDSVFKMKGSAELISIPYHDFPQDRLCVGESHPV
jgi:hypothetical protein